MKKIVFFLFLFGCLSAIHSQDYKLSFTGSGASSVVDSIYVQNLTQGTVLLLGGSDTLHLVSSLGIKIPNTGPAKLKIHPNPISDESRIEVYIPSSGNAGLEVLDGKGNKILSIYRQLYRGIHSFSLRGLISGIYYLKLTTSDFICTDKILSLGAHAETPSMEYLKGAGCADLKYDLKAQTGLVTMQYNEGERLLFKGYSGDFSRVLTMVPVNSQVVDFEFVPCSDADGNHYAVVTIGTQVWMAENLKTTKYRNGDVIANETNNSSWFNLTQGAYCNYNNDENIVRTYGRLYNWFAVNDSRNIAPEGWHIPSDEEWMTSINYVGGLNFAGGKFKESGTLHWNSPNTGATNESGFTALPGGSAGQVYVDDLGVYGLWWSSSQYSVSDAWFNCMGYDYANISRGNADKNYGFSIRCVKD